VWAPVFGAAINYPEIKPPGGGGGGIGKGILSGKVPGSFNGAALLGLDIVKSHVVFHGDGMWASVSADHTTPQAHIGVNILHGTLLGGYEVLDGWSFEAGVRPISMRVSASVEDRPGISVKPGIWDPLAGTT
jgi:hypothetical protein